LILPNIAALSDRQCEQLTRYVENGGSIVATHETSLYDEWGKKRNDFGLAGLFGASYDGKTDTHVQNSYLDIGKPHPVVRGLEDATRIVNGVAWVHTKATVAPAVLPLTLVPSYPDLPMEEVYARVPHTDIPGVYVRQHGKGRVVYFPFDLDRTFWEFLVRDHSLLLRNAALWAHAGEQPMSVAGKGMIDVSVWEQKGSLTAHMVNLTNPMTMKGPVRELIPSQPQKIRVRIPAGKRVKSARFLVSTAPVKYRVAGGVIEADVPPFELNEALAVDLG
jgi:type 1 glutamine amidotransferase